MVCSLVSALGAIDANMQWMQSGCKIGCHTKSRTIIRDRNSHRAQLDVVRGRGREMDRRPYDVRTHYLNALCSGCVPHACRERGIAVEDLFTPSLQRCVLPFATSLQYFPRGQPGKEVEKYGCPPGLSGMGAGCASMWYAALAVGRRGALSAHTDDSCSPIGGRAAGWLWDNHGDVARQVNGHVRGC